MQGQERETHLKRFAMLLACLMALGAAGAAAAPADFELTIQDTPAGAVVTGYSGQAPSVLRIPDGIAAIGEEAFWKCGELEEIILPEGLRQVGRGAFLGCANVAQVTLPGSLAEILDGAFCGTGIRTLVLPESVRQVAWGAFNNCTSLESVMFPAALHTIGTNAFRGCTALAQVEIPEGVRYIGGFAFAGCTSLAAVHLPSTLLSLQDGAFKGCTRLTDMVIPEGPTYLSYTFADCSHLETVSVPASVVQIEGHVFSKCDSLTTVRYGGTRAAWDKALTYGDSSVHSRVEVLCAGDEEQTAQEDAAGGLSLRNGSRFAADGGFIRVHEAGTPVSAAELAAAFVMPEGTKIEILAGGQVRSGAEIVGTGTQIGLMSAGRQIGQAVLVVPGDVLGTGQTSVAQLVRMAQALNGSAPLSGPHLAAGCLTGGKTVSAADIVCLAQLLAG